MRLALETSQRLYRELLCDGDSFGRLLLRADLGVRAHGRWGDGEVSEQCVSV